MPPTFAEAVRGMTVGSYSAQPVQTDSGYHVILLEDTQRKQPPTLDEIRNDLAAAAERKVLDNYIKTLRESASVSLEP
jgi:peptidyl-prolyl cis-trans isomerase C